jgi:cytochrome c-type biogenesis protein
MIDGIGHLVDSGPLLLAMPVALAAGAVTFLSPCCLPLVPGYLSYLTGMSGTAVRAPEADAAPVPAAVGAAAVGAAAAGTGGATVTVPVAGRAARPPGHGPGRPRDAAVRARLLRRVRHRGPGAEQRRADPA